MILYNKALAHYHKKNSMVAAKALPIVKDIFKTRGATVENILVPFYGWKKTSWCCSESGKIRGNEQCRAD